MGACRQRSRSSPRDEKDTTLVGPTAPTPADVRKALEFAYGGVVEETGYNIAAATCTSDAEKATARERGSSLLYGELLPDGVSKILLPNRIGAACGGEERKRLVLELGMGSGKVALQLFLQCPQVDEVLGVEIVRSRYDIANGAMKRFASAMPERYHLSESSEGEVCQIKDQIGERSLRFQCGDFFALGLDLCARCDAIVFAVNIPCSLFPDLCKHFASAKDGCRLFTYHPLPDIWWSSEKCPFHQVEANIAESDTFATSWSPLGYRFYVYVCDRSRPSTIQASRSETFTQWQSVLDSQSGTYYFHNTESETSQWEMPTTAGAWQVLRCEEQKAYFYCHTPSGHSQWEPPKCLADLGWTLAE